MTLTVARWAQHGTRHAGHTSIDDEAWFEWWELEAEQGRLRAESERLYRLRRRARHQPFDHAAHERLIRDLRTHRERLVAWRARHGFDGGSETASCISRILSNKTAPGAE